MEKIDLSATAELIRALRPGSIAAHCGVTVSLVSQVLNNKYPRMDAPKAQRVLDRLRELGVLVETSEDTHSNKLAA